MCSVPSEKAGVATVVDSKAGSSFFKVFSIVPVIIDLSSIVLRYFLGFLVITAFDEAGKAVRIHQF